MKLKNHPEIKFPKYGPLTGSYKGKIPNSFLSNWRLKDVGPIDKNKLKLRAESIDTKDEGNSYIKSENQRILKDLKDKILPNHINESLWDIGQVEIPSDF